jgi:uncharacterized membrane protein
MFKLFLLGVIVFVLYILLDLVWFTLAGDFFKSQIGSIARLLPDGSWNVLYIPAVLAYVLMAIGVVVFVLPQATGIGSALLLGGLFGLISFGLYDMTNLATLRAWTIPFAIADMTWGTFVSAVVSGAVYYISKFSYFAHLP